MARREYFTLGEELAERAEQIFEFFKAKGYRVAVEKAELNYPFTPTFVCTRGPTTLIVEVDGKPPLDRMEEWARYAHSCAKDTRVAIALVSDKPLPTPIEVRLRGLGVGVFVLVSDGVFERIPPQDLALSLALPDISSCSPRIRTLLGPAYDQFDRSEWRDGFGSACQAFEEQARRHLKTSLSHGRVSLVDGGGRPRLLRSEQVDKLTLGQLAVAYGQIVAPNHADSKVAQALKRLYEDRNALIHKKGAAQTEKKLRKNVGGHVWTIVAGLKALEQ